MNCISELDVLYSVLGTSSLLKGNGNSLANVNWRLHICELEEMKKLISG